MCSDVCISQLKNSAGVESVELVLRGSFDMGSLFAMGVLMSRSKMGSDVSLCILQPKNTSSSESSMSDGKLSSCMNSAGVASVELVLRGSFDMGADVSSSSPLTLPKVRITGYILSKFFISCSDINSTFFCPMVSRMSQPS